MGEKSLLRICLTRREAAPRRHEPARECSNAVSTIFKAASNAVYVDVDGAIFFAARVSINYFLHIAWHARGVRNCAYDLVYY